MYLNNNPLLINININLQSTNQRNLINYKNKLQTLFKNNNFKFKLIALPTKIKHYPILRSPHVYKKSLEIFEERIYTINFIFYITQYSSYLRLFYIIKFIKYNTPLNINMKFKVQNNV